MFFLKNCLAQQQIPELKVDEKYFNQVLHRTISSDYIKQCQENKIIPIKSTVKKIKDDSVVLTALNQNNKEIVC